MASRECKTCLRRFGSGINQAACIWCGGHLVYNTGTEPTVEKEEYEARLYVIGKKVPATLPADELGRVEQDWAAIDAELAKRGTDLWSEADLVSEARFWESVRGVS